MISIRKAGFAGSWYPAGASACEQQILEFLEEGKQWSVPDEPYVGGIVPHAGWFFSGAIACNVIHALKGREAASPDAVLIFGMHLPSGAPNYLMTDGAWDTPFGEIPIHTDLAESLADQF